MRAKSETPSPINVEHFPRMWRDRLNNQVNFEGIDDARATLSDALEQLSKRYNLPYRVDEKTFQADNPKQDVLGFEIVKKRPFPPMRLKLSNLLQNILDRLPTKSGALFLIRKDYIEITTGAAVRAELGIPSDRPLLPLVWNSFENVPISEALIALSAESGYNVVADPRASDKLQTPTGITTLYNVPVDTAVRLLANMADVSMVRLDNVFYLTTEENAKHLRAEQARINGNDPMGGMLPAKPASDKPAK